MAATVFAGIRPQDYAAFLSLKGNDFPDNYDTWLYQHEKRTRREEHVGWSVIREIVFPDEFSQYCKRTNSTPTQFNLDVCAREKHKQQQEREKDKPTK